MTNPEVATRPSRPRPDITLPDGRVLTPRARLAEEVGISDRTAARKNPETTYVSGVAYVDRASGLQDIVGKLRRRNQPARHKRSRTASKQQPLRMKMFAP